MRTHDNKLGPELNEACIKDVLFQIRYFFDQRFPYPQNRGLVGYLDTIEPYLINDLKWKLMCLENSDDPMLEMARHRWIKIQTLLETKINYPELYEHLKLTLIGNGGPVEFLETLLKQEKPEQEITHAALEINYDKIKKDDDQE